MASQIGRVLLHILAPLRLTEEAHGWASLLWQVIVLTGLSVGAASILTGSPFAIVVYPLLIALALTFLAAYRLQGRTDRAEKLRYTRDQLIDARKKLGRLMTDGGDMLIAEDSGKTFQQEASEFFGQVLGLLRSDTPIFDESHLGRFYAASTDATRKCDTTTIEGLREVLHAQLGSLKDFVLEINAELNTLAR